MQETQGNWAVGKVITVIAECDPGVAALLVILFGFQHTNILRNVALRFDRMYLLDPWVALGHSRVSEIKLRAGQAARPLDSGKP